MTFTLSYEFEGEEYELTPIQIDILETLERVAPIARGYNGEEGTLIAVMNRARSTLYDNLEKLEDKGLVKRIEYDNGKPGRPKVLWSIKSNDNNNGDKASNAQ
jgi:DNA-binding MarR family transcriptional regulator